MRKRILAINEESFHQPELEKRKFKDKLKLKHFFTNISFNGSFIDNPKKEIKVLFHELKNHHVCWKQNIYISKKKKRIHLKKTDEFYIMKYVLLENNNLKYININLLDITTNLRK